MWHVVAVPARVCKVRPAQTLVKTIFDAGGVATWRAPESTRLLGATSCRIYLDCTASVRCADMEGARHLGWMAAAAVAAFLAGSAVTRATTLGRVARADIGYTEEAACELRIEFISPDDWRCAAAQAGQCTVCRNVSDHASDLLMHCVDQEGRERRHVPAGAELSVCRADAARRRPI